MIVRARLWRWYWMPVTVFAIGIFSTILLLWADLLRERQRNSYALINAVMEAEISTATSHLWFEQALRGDGDTEGYGRQAVADLDNATTLIDLTMRGGRFEHRLIVQPLEAPEHRAAAEELKSLLLKFKEIGLLRLQAPERSGSGSFLDRKSHPIFSDILKKSSDLEDMVVANTIQENAESARLFLVVIFSWILVLVAVSAGLAKRERQRKSAEEALVKAHEQLLSQAEELTEHREHLSELVERRTVELEKTNESLRDEIDERLRTEGALRQADGQLRRLSSQLLSAEEAERRRISRGLHDGLGQSLNYMKLQLSFIENRLRPDQDEIRKECGELREYAAQVIEDVRRLSRDLSPTVLEDLGLSAAVRWLMDNFAKSGTIHMTSDLAEIDNLFTEKDSIFIFRIIQEILTNIAKHAQAQNVSVVARENGDRVTFVIEDDGKGFDVEGETARNSSEKGLGLPSMAERVKMLGGTFELRSLEGKGTSIKFTVPVVKGDA